MAKTCVFLYKYYTSKQRILEEGLVPCWIEDEALPFLIRTSHRKNAFASGIIYRSKAMVPGTIAAQYNEKELPNGNVH